jgi:hypothetical protein
LILFFGFYEDSFGKFRGFLFEDDEKSVIEFVGDPIYVTGG